MKTRHDNRGEEQGRHSNGASQSKKDSTKILILRRFYESEGFTKCILIQQTLSR
ncbi:hypothetical protein [Vulcanisaeta sp. JCM 14467]|uniref:hypothetical protein n=1 Tax=Vulcanisaeta sp. JCM 14467 TaxID=1295370 RepID=UPI0020934BBD|nr:hypothetical protein [Vulcanisaeta sp. JCM 14467]